MSPVMETVYVVDDDPVLIDSIQEMLLAGGLTVEAFSSAADFRSAFSRDNAGCVVLDICMPGTDGLDLCEELRSKHPRLPIIIVTGHADIPKARRGFKLGVADFIEKPLSSRQLLSLVRATLVEGRAARERDIFEAEVLERIGRLSARERQVLDLVVAGLLNKQIAESLKIHERTVEFHRRNIMAKTEVGSVAELIALSLTCHGAAARDGEWLAPGGPTTPARTRSGRGWQRPH